MRDGLKDLNLRIRDQEALPYWERKEKEETAVPTVRVGFVGAGQFAQHHLKVMDCFVVVLPPHKIKSVVMQCLRTGKPVLMEKPAGLTSDETLELVQQAEKYNTFGMVGFNRRFYSVLEHGLAALAHSGPLRGAVLEIPEAITDERQRGRYTEWEYDHFMFLNSIHGIDLLRYILGEVVAVHSMVRPNQEFKNRAASFAGTLEHEQGGMSTVLALWDTPSVFHLKIIAEEGSLEFEPLQRGWFVKTRGSKEVVKIPIRPDPVDTHFRTGIYAQDLHFIRAVRQGKTPSIPACLLPDAYKTHLLIEKIFSHVSISDKKLAPPVDETKR